MLTQEIRYKVLGGAGMSAVPSGLADLISTAQGSKEFNGRCDLRAGCCALFRGRSIQNVRFSNRPFGVKRFQTIHPLSVDVAHGLVLLFGIGTRGPSIMGFEDEVEQSFGRPCRQTNGRSKRTCELTSSIVPRGTSFHRSVEFEFPPIGLDAARFHAAVVACSRVQRNSVPSTHMRCIITANRRGQGRDRLFHPATPGDLHRPALSQDHYAPIPRHPARRPHRIGTDR